MSVAFHRFIKAGTWAGFFLFVFVATKVGLDRLVLILVGGLDATTCLGTMSLQEAANQVVQCPTR